MVVKKTIRIQMTSCENRATEYDKDWCFPIISSLHSSYHVNIRPTHERNIGFQIPPLNIFEQEEVDLQCITRSFAVFMSFLINIFYVIMVMAYFLTTIRIQMI